MSTRSGKRIHKSIDNPIEETEIVFQSERKTRTKKQKENVEMSVKKKHNYVSFPGNSKCESLALETQNESRRRTRRDTLKEHNVDVPINTEANCDTKSVRKSRRCQKLLEEAVSASYKENIETVVPLKSNAKDEKKSKKKKKASLEATDVSGLNNIVASKKKDKKKKIPNIIVTNEDMDHSDSNISRGNMSVESFHSAAGSLANSEQTKHDNDDTMKSNHETNLASSSIGYEENSTFNKAKEAPAFFNSTDENISKKEKKMTSNNSTLNKSHDKPNAGTVSKKRRNFSVIKRTLNNFEDIFKLNDINNASEAAGNLYTSYDKENSRANFMENNEKAKNSSDLTPADLKDSENQTVSDILNTTVDKVTNNKRKSNINNSTFDKSDNDSKGTVPKKTKKYSTKKSTPNTSENIIKLNDKNEKSEYQTATDSLSTTVNKASNKKRKSSLNNSTFDKPQDTPEKESRKRNKSSVLNSTLACSPLNEITVNDHNETDNLNTTVDKDLEPRRKSSIKNSTYDKSELENANTTFGKDNTGPGDYISDLTSSNSKRKSPTNNMMLSNSVRNLIATTEKTPKLSKTKSLDRTFDKVSNTDMNNFEDSENKGADKPENSLKKSSLISSDSSNITLDKSEEDLTRISITSDESKTENILNYTPVLIESSIDETQVSVSKTPEQSLQAPMTPLKREGTFTKDSPDVTMSPSSKISSVITPERRKSLPSPGCTPFPFTKSSEKEKRTLNVTRSLEKPSLRMSMADPAPRQTKVMFRSPMNNPALVSQVKGRVIKSSLKGSSKSFILDDSALSAGCAGAGAARRKRSLTLGAPPAAAKRSRVDDTHRAHHTPSAAAKPVEASASKKPPSTAERGEKGAKRTRLPNFAALHRAQFAKMESLVECKTRRERRAKLLLTPTGALAMLERISPKGTPPKTEAGTSEGTRQTDKESSSKPPSTKYTLASLNPGYTRFGFKLKTDVNPFVQPVRAEAKPDQKEDRPARLNGLSRQAKHLPLPSLAGATASRREAAKQTVMREKSFSERRDLERAASRTVIRGVRTNRRFELQMQMRNIQP